MLSLLAALAASGCGTLRDVLPDRAPSLRPAALPELPGGEARADIVDVGGRALGGAIFAPSPNGVVMRLQVRGLPDGWHGMHLHAVGDCSGPGFTTAGPHVKHAGQTQHGLQNPQGPEAGDLPNLWVEDGRATVELFTGMATLRGGGGGTNRVTLLDADGASLVIHAGPDDHRTQPIGGSGDRIACGVIRPAL
jgi:Cu-Zn family superoxide dismutase